MEILSIIFIFNLQKDYLIFVTFRISKYYNRNTRKIYIFLFIVQT